MASCSIGYSRGSSQRGGANHPLVGEKNTMRTLEEVVARANELEDDFFGFRMSILVDYLPFDLARPFLVDDATAEEWGDVPPLIREHVIGEMRSYMEFAWGKVEDHRGLSAGRSVQKMESWLWLLGDDALMRFAADGDNYAMYGAPVLKRICEAYGFSISDSSALANMAQGKPCRPGCNEGC